MATRDLNRQDSYIEKTAKLVPAEALALYLTLSGQVKAATMNDMEAQRTITLVVALVVCFVIVPFVLYKLQRVRAPAHYLISMVAFALWVFNAQYDRLPMPPNFPYDSINVAVGSVVLLIFTFLAPFMLPEKE